MTAEPMQKTTLKDWIADFLFWTWNLIFLAFMLLGLAPRLLPLLFVDVRSGLIPVNYLIYATALSAIPVVTVILGLIRFRQAPGSLFALGYVVEGPLMLLLAVRFFLIRQATPALALVMYVAGIGMAAFLWHLLDPAIERRGRFLGSLRLVGLTLMALTSLYAAVWIAFYAVPLATFALAWIGRTLANLPGFLRNFIFDIENMIRGGGLAWIPFSIFGFILVLYSATLFVLTPIAVPILSMSTWWRSLQALVARLGRPLPALLVALTVLVTGALFVATNRQPQNQVFALLAKPPASPEEAQVLLKKQESIRSGLLNAYLAPFRYMSSMGEVRHISGMYEEAFHLNPQRAFEVQQWYEDVARPLLYDPVHPKNFSDPADNIAFQNEPLEAARLYQRFFDSTIVEGERQTIVRAVRSTWSAQQAESAWQAVDEREVYLVRQEVNVSEHGDWAEVELYEMYQNQTPNRREVIYYFNLPESAVLTGVWLGNSPDREARFTFQVAPRGAAQAVYRNETRVNRDPALLEQIGPRQYRLRAFPVPPVTAQWNDESTRLLVEEAQPLFVWLTYRTMADGASWPLPHLALRRNVYWDESTVRLLNGAPMQVENDAWLPEAAPASQPVQPMAHRVDFPGGTSVIALPAAQAALPELPPDLRLAVVLDTSRSMATHNDQLTAALSHLQEVAGLEAPVDIYLTTSNFSGEEPARLSLAAFDPGKLVYFGGQNAADLLAQFEGLRQGKAYDAILVFTDGSGYELGVSPEDVTIPEAPVWVVHLGGEISLGYDDQTLEAIQASGGGVAGDLDQALRRLALNLSATSSTQDSTMRDVLDGYVWSVMPSAQAEAEASEAVSHTDEDGFVALAARRVILAEMHRQRGTLSQLDTLDRLHALAQEYGIVTPYSSMIVLVNEVQQQILENLEENPDRFNREFEDLGNTTPSTQTPLTGVPEPEEWLLLSLAAALLLWYASQQRAARQRA